MSQHKVYVTREYALPVETVYARLVDHNRLGALLGVPVRRIVDAPGDDPNGVGSVRRIGVGPLAIEETITDAVPGTRIGYRISKGGAPIRNHRGWLTFSPTAHGSRLRWSIEFEAPQLAGLAVRAALTAALTLGLRRVR